MLAYKLLARLVIYYVILAGIVAGLLLLFPGLHEHLPVGRVQSLIAQAGGPLMKGQIVTQAAHVTSLSASVIWMASVMVGALLVALPVAWVYIEVRTPDQYDQSMVGTIVVLPFVVASIVVIVQDSLALSFSLAGIAGVARYRNSMKSSGDLLFILLAIGIGLAAGIGAMELAIVTTIIFNLCFVLLWTTEFGERDDMKRYLRDFRTNEVATVAVAAAAVVVEEVVHTKAKKGEPPPADSPAAPPADPPAA